MSHDTEIDWLLEERPEPDAPSSASTDRARAALLAHGDRVRRGRRRRSGALAVGGVLAAGAAAAVVVGQGGQGGHVARHRSHQTLAIAGRTDGRAPRTGARSSTPLVALAADVRRLPARPQPGDATLVVRYTILDGHHRIGGAVYGGYDLYTDSGRYYYAPDSLAQLQQLVRSGQAVNLPGDEARALRTIARAAAGTPGQARSAILSTEPHHGRPTPMTAAQRRKFMRTLPARIRHRLSRRVITALEGPVIDLRAHDDSLVWIDATTALAVGAGRPDVRAACIKALDTLHGVRETRARVHGVNALRVSFPDGPVQETVWLDARTGEPIQERDGSNSTTTYAVQRVTAAHLPAHVSLHSILR